MTTLVRHDSYWPLIAQRKGWDYDFLRELNRSSTHELSGMRKFIAGLREILLTNQTITIWPDYDMDGISAGTILYAGLSELGFNVHMVIPDYSGSRNLEPIDIDHILTIYPDTSAVITCDGGINSREGIDYAHDKGLSVFVSDHHQEDEELCPAEYVINPNRFYEVFEHNDICGAQVAHMALMAYTHHYDPRHVAAIERLRLFAGIGALADVMPVSHQTRVDVRATINYLHLLTPKMARDRFGGIDPHGRDEDDPLSPLMDILHAEHHHPHYTDAFMGMAKLLKELGYAKKLYDTDSYDESIIGFTIAPMFNATRRVEADMSLNICVFSPSVNKIYAEHGYRVETNTTAAIKQLIANNELRKNNLNRFLDEVTGYRQHYAPHIYLTPQPIPAGFLGLIAASLLSSTKTTAVIVLNEHTDGSFSGSARAAGINIREIANSTPGCHAAGHNHACGISCDSPEAVSALFFAIRAASDHYSEPEYSSDLTLVDIPSAWAQHMPEEYTEHIDGDVDCEAIIELVDTLNELKPFGMGFDYPIIDIIIDPNTCQFRRLSNGKHLKITTPSGMTLLKWNADEDFMVLIDQAQTEDNYLILTIECGINIFNTTISAQGVINDAAIIHTI